MFTIMYNAMNDNDDRNTEYSNNYKHDSEMMTVLLEKRNDKIIFNNNFLYICGFIEKYNNVIKGDDDMKLLLEKDPEFLDNIKEFITLFLNNIEKTYYEIDNTHYLRNKFVLIRSTKDYYNIDYKIGRYLQMKYGQNNYYKNLIKFSIKYNTSCKNLQEELMEILKNSITFYKQIREIFIEYVNTQKIMLSIFNTEIDGEINDILNIEDYFIDPLDAINLILNNNNIIQFYIKNIKINNIINNDEDFIIDFNNSNNNMIINYNKKEEYLADLKNIINKDLRETYNSMNEFIEKYNIKNNIEDKNIN